jgi:hypothetical protein
MSQLLQSQRGDRYTQQRQGYMSIVSRLENLALPFLILGSLFKALEISLRRMGDYI